MPTPPSLTLCQLVADEDWHATIVVGERRSSVHNQLWRPSQVHQDVCLASKISPTRVHAPLLALLSLTNYSASTQRPIVAFTREYTWDIESKER